jgi:hypothetical protein
VDGYAFISSASTVPVAVPELPAAPEPLALRAFPSPTTGAVRVRFALDREERATVAVYDVRGRLVRTLADGASPRGEHLVSWDGTDARGGRAAPGVYFVRLQTLDRVRSTRVTVVE